MESFRWSLYAEEVTVYEAIGRRLAALRRERGLTQEQLAERAGTSSAYVARIEAGGRRATVEMLARLATALDVPLWRLFASSRITRAEREVVVVSAELAGLVEEMDAGGVRLLVEVARRFRG